jgi:murein L,D-transpeptidase YcbB/YkuD
MFRFWYLVFIASLCCPAVSTADADIQNIIRNRIEAGGIPLKISVAGEPIHATVVLPRFYERRAYRPAWSKNRGPSTQVMALDQSLHNAAADGLRPADYHLDKITRILEHLDDMDTGPGSPDAQLLADLDILLTDAYLILGAHMLAGRIDPERLDPMWKAQRRNKDLAADLEDALNAERVGESLADLLPRHSGYFRLKKALGHYREIDAAGGWQPFPGGAKLQPGDRENRVSLLRNRLAVEGFIENPAKTNDPEFFDNSLADALKRFQTRAGLEPDGVVGPQTRQALNLSVQQRIRQIIVNMERWRWLPQDLGARYLLVNIAAFSLTVFEEDQTVLKMRVVVGKPYRRTPVFSDMLTYLVLNPYWNLPPTIAIKDILPKVKNDPDFLTKQKIRVLQGWNSSTREVDPASVNWQTVSARNFPYRFRQDPGPQNALGRIKFMFPNPYDVYLHDTPSKELFSKARRDFSSGCIRIEKPLELAEYLLRKHPDWPAEKIVGAVSGPDITEKTIKLPEPLTIHLLYWTIWVDEQGLLHFGPDVYDRDEIVDAALQQPPPAN